MRFISIIIVLLLWPSILSAQNSSSARDFLKRGNLLYSKGDLEGAINSYNKALAASPEMTDALVARGKALRLKGDFDGAIEDFEQAAVLDLRILSSIPEAAATYTMRGNLRVNSFDLDGAVADFDKAVRCEPASADPVIKRGEAKLIRGDFNEAISDFDAGLLLRPGKLQSSLALAGRGYANLLIGNDRKAEKDFEQSVNLNNEGKFFLTLHLKLLESKIREVKRRRAAEQQLIASY
jgi:tetratricopeptide (TPR) repeat protein